MVVFFFYWWMRVSDRLSRPRVIKHVVGEKMSLQEEGEVILIKLLCVDKSFTTNTAIFHKKTKKKNKNCPF